MPTGTVKWYDEVRGVGVIVTEDGEELYFDRDALLGGWLQTMAKGREAHAASDEPRQPGKAPPTQS